MPLRLAPFLHLQRPLRAGEPELDVARSSRCSRIRPQRRTKARANPVQSRASPRTMKRSATTVRSTSRPILFIVFDTLRAVFLYPPPCS